MHNLSLLTKKNDANFFLTCLLYIEYHIQIMSRLLRALPKYFDLTTLPASFNAT